jgi:hypothetical protein
MTATARTDVLIIGGGMAGAWAAIAAARLRAGQGLGDGGWMHRILDLTWRTLPTLAPEYSFPRTDDGETNDRAVRGPEYMPALRARLDKLGIRVLDHHPALELLAWWQYRRRARHPSPACQQRLGNPCRRRCWPKQPRCWRAARSGNIAATRAGTNGPAPIRMSSG